MSENSNLSNQDIEEYINNTDIHSSKPVSHSILVVDDDIWMHKVLNKYLTSWGFNHLQALDAFDGIALAIKFRPQLIFLDILMPEINGESILRLLKKVELTSSIPVIIISANLNKELLQMTYNSGAKGFISKPFSEKVLFDKIFENIEPSPFFEKLNAVSNLSNDLIKDENLY